MSTMQQRTLRLALLLLAVVVSATTGITEPKTGVSFPNQYKGSKLTKTGVRSKGPIKIYAVGQYGNDVFLLQMARDVGKAKMASALKAALKPRCSAASTVDEFERLMLRGLPSGAKIAFGTGSGELSLFVNGRNVGSIVSKPLATAFGKIYTDGNAVCSMNPV